MSRTWAVHAQPVGAESENRSVCFVCHDFPEAPFDCYAPDPVLDKHGQFAEDLLTLQ